MKFIKEWTDFENQQKQVFSAFQKWEKFNLSITNGCNRGNIENKYGLPYTSSGAFAGVWNTNCESVYKWLPKFRFDGVAISEDNFIVALFSHIENEKNINVIIGAIN